MLRHSSFSLLALTGFSLLALSACDNTVSDYRTSRFVTPTVQNPTVKPSVLAVHLALQPDLLALSADSRQRANTLLKAQGRLVNQILTLTPYSPRGAEVAHRLADLLIRAGARPSKVTVTPIEPRPAEVATTPLPQSAAASSPPAPIPDSSATSKTAAPSAAEDVAWDLELRSDAIAVTVPDCKIADPHMWGIKPYSAIGSLGCANRANLALMVADPRDMVQPQALAPVDGIIAEQAVDRYHDDDVKELLDIDFEN